jgi:hypothetical protein
MNRWTGGGATKCLLHAHTILWDPYGVVNVRESLADLLIKKNIFLRHVMSKTEKVNPKPIVER